jgi:hypothetical protein
VPAGDEVERERLAAGELCRTGVGISCNSSATGGLIKAKTISRPLAWTADQKPFCRNYAAPIVST